MGAVLTSKSSNFLTIKNISALRGDVPVLRNFSLDLNQGEWIIVRGRNGSGKSTLLQAIAGLLPLYHGEITKVNSCYLGHQNGFRDLMTVGQHLQFIAKFFGTQLKPTPIDHLFEVPIHHLSAGLKRQVALSQFILSPHKLWIIDEPFEHLDQQGQAYFQDLMKSHIEQGGAILMTNHESLRVPQIKEVWLTTQ